MHLFVYLFIYLFILCAASGEGGEGGGRLDEEPQDLSLRMEDSSASSFAAPGGSEASASASEAAAEAGSSHEVLMPGTSQVPYRKLHFPYV
jgi:hypothetical protein